MTTQWKVEAQHLWTCQTCMERGHRHLQSHWHRSSRTLSSALPPTSPLAASTATTSPALSQCTNVLSNDCTTTYWHTLDNKTQQGNHRHQTSPPCCIWRQRQTAWRPLMNTLHILTTCFSTAPTVLLPTPRAVWSIMWKQDVIHKQKVQDVFHCYQRKNEPRPQVTCTENFEVSTCGFWDMQADRQTITKTDRHTDTFIAILWIHTAGEVIIKLKYNR